MQQFALGANPLHPLPELPEIDRFGERPHGDGVLPLLQVSLPNVGANSFQPRIIGCRSRKFLLPLVVQGVLHVGLATRVISLIGFIDQASQFGKSRIRATILAHVVLFDGVWWVSMGC